MAIRNRQTIYDSFDNEHDSFPRSTSGSGTISTNTSGGRGTIVTGSSTSFTSELQVGDFIYDSNQPTSAFRRIRRIMSDTELEIEEAFNSDLSSINLVYISNPMRFATISWQLDGSQADINGVTLLSDTSGQAGSTRSRGSGRSFATPLDIDTTSNGGTLIIEATT